MNKRMEEKVYEDLLNERIIFLNEEINSKSAGNIVAKLLYLDSKSNEDITIYINSPGGMVSSGLMIYDTIKHLKSNVVTVGIGLSASMAAIILLSGTKGKRKILPHAKVMLHDVSGGTEGSYKDILVATKEIQKTHNILFKIIKENTILTDDEIEKNLSSDYWLDSSEALEKSIVDSIII